MNSENKKARLILQVLSSRRGQPSPVTETPIADNDPRTVEAISRDAIKSYKAEQGPDYMREPRVTGTPDIHGTFVRASVVQVLDDGSRSPHHTTEYNHVRGTHEIPPQVLKSPVIDIQMVETAMPDVPAANVA